MHDNQFFKHTSLYKEYLLLDLAEKDSNITQRFLSEMIGSSVSMINTYIEEYEKKGYIKRLYLTNKNLEYNITKKGIQRKKLLNIHYLKDIHNIYLSAKENVSLFLNQIILKGYKNILQYGVGEVADLLLQVINLDNEIQLNVLAVIDDDINKHGLNILNHKIVSNKIICILKHDGILTSGYSQRQKIYNNLLCLWYKKEDILMFFEI